MICILIYHFLTQVCMIKDHIFIQNVETIVFCTFDSCISTLKCGGSLGVIQDCHDFIHRSDFINSSTSTKYGGAIYVCSKEGDLTLDDNNNTELEQLNVQYCCFSGCFGNRADTLYGAALFTSAKNTILLYTAAVNCPPIDKSRVHGAQFYMRAQIIRSNNVNITGGKSKYCAGIE